MTSPVADPGLSLSTAFGANLLQLLLNEEPTSLSIGLEEPKKGSAKPPSEPRIKRPMNAFMVWSQMKRAEITAAGQKVHNSDVSKMLGKEWRAMEEPEKLPFVQKARELREEHFREHPNYVYKPRRRKRSLKSISSDSATDVVDANPHGLLPTILMNQILCNQFLSQFTSAASSSVAD